MSWRSAPRRGRTTLYRLFDGDDALLYIGVTNDLPARLLAHRTADRFHGIAVARVESQEFESRDDALDAEISAIRSEEPAFNVHYNWRSEEVAS